MKLVRDLVPQIIRLMGERPVVHVAADRSEFIDRLIRKIQEEAEELLVAGPDHVIEELADVLEAADALRNELGSALVDAARAKKAKERGTFKKRFVLEGTSK